MAAELAGSGVPGLGDAALGFLRDAEALPGEVVLGALVAQAGRHPVLSQLVESRVSLRPWLPPGRQGWLDAATRMLQAHSLAPVCNRLLGYHRVVSLVVV